MIQPAATARNARARAGFPLNRVIPLARRGRHILANIKPTHKRCNRVKWASLPPELVAAELGKGGDAEG